MIGDEDHQGLISTVWCVANLNREITQLYQISEIFFEDEGLHDVLVEKT